MMLALAADMPPAIVQCRESKPERAEVYWAWRMIEGRQCWYPGRPGKSRELLRWGKPSPRPQADEGTGEPSAPVPEPMTIEPKGGFEDRWRGIQELCSGSDCRSWEAPPMEIK